MTDQKTQVLLLHPDDDILVALADLPAGAKLEPYGLTCKQDIPAGHKVARRDLSQGQAVRKYGQIIGAATQAIAAGEHVHSHNLHFEQFERDLAIGSEAKPTVYVPPEEQATFSGYLRADGRAATRNYLGVLATVNCSASVCRFIADALEPELLAQYTNVDGVVALGHGNGCGQSAASTGFEYLQRCLAGYARHPNFAGVLLVGLGCEVNQLGSLMENMNLSQGPLLRAMNIQDAGGTAKTVAWGVDLLKEMLPVADQARRQTLPASHLVLGLECGGSDAYSGLTANPALGAAADLLVTHGGTAILSETPEIYGAEHLLTRRAISQEVGEKLAARIRWWEDYTALHGASLDNNPSPGNKAGGLTTILEKSLGAVAKGGTTNLVEVYEYARPVSAKGMVFMDTPGYDMPSITGMVAGGANLVCFTTGRGTVCGSKPTPSLKLATNSAMYARMAEDMDINCGLIAEGKSTVEEMGQTIFKLILTTASGQPTKSEALGFGDQEFVPWQVGAML
ncbi:MAG: altronate dehydratase family protein [Deltaproteobacteria bacterium]|nr:altronate dehydratase family protein [Deltaproteobacteria bacterium]